MSHVSDGFGANANVFGKRAVLLGPGTSIAALLLDVGVIAGAAILTGAIHQLAFHGDLDSLRTSADAGLLMGVVYIIVRASRGAYDVRHAVRGAFAGRQIFAAWNLTLFTVLALAFLTKQSATYSRIWLLLFYVMGFIGLSAVHMLITGILRQGVRDGRFITGRIALIGSAGAITEFHARHDFAAQGLAVVSSTTLPVDPVESGRLLEGDEQDRALEAAVESIRASQADEVLLVMPWSEQRTIDACHDVLSATPAAVYLGLEPTMERFWEIEPSPAMPFPCLRLARAPLSPFEVLAKRAFDIVVASLALVLLSPLLALVAFLIKRDSPGPVLFRQDRLGFNQQPFSIFKFRSMSVTENGDVVEQAKRGDVRITRIGRFLRASSIDELPQLINVVKGEMSLVGPRPHAMKHDREFAEKVERYARRHNVKPGITGWAQVNGYRGETDTDEKIRGRVQHDLHYIDNWSLGLDLVIMVRTISPKALFNVY